MATKAIQATCLWCEDEKTFAGDDPEDEWRRSGWLIYMDEEDGEKEFCCLSCAIAAL